MQFDYTSCCLLDYNDFKKYYKMIAIDLNKQPALDTDPRAKQQINFSENLARDPNVDTALISLLKKQKKPH